jgi:hypothetical protein
LTAINSPASGAQYGVTSADTRSAKMAEGCPWRTKGEVAGPDMALHGLPCLRRFPSDVLRFVSAWALCLVCVSPALALDVVSPATGRVTLESVDAWLATPLGEIAVSRAYDDSADGGTAARGWA